MGILVALFTSLIFLIPTGVLFRIDLGSSAYVYPQDIVAGLIFLIFVSSLIKKKKVPQKKLFMLNLLFVLTGFGSLLLNLQYLDTTSFFVSLGYLLRYVVYSNLLFAVTLLPESFTRSLPGKLLFSGTIFLALGLLQYFFYPNLRNLYYLGWDEHLGRLFSTFLDPNFAGVFISLPIVICLSLVFSKKNVKSSAFYLLGFFLSGLFLTHSRSAILALVAASTVYFALSGLYKQAIVFIAIVAAGILVVSDANVEGLNPFRIASSEARIDSAKTATSIIERHLFFGVGFNAYRYAQERYGFSASQTGYPNNSDAGTDNSFLFVLATTGIVGFLFYIDFWINVFRVYTRDKFSSIESRVGASSVVAILTASLFINALFYVPIMAWIFILIGVTLSKKQLGRAL